MKTKNKDNADRDEGRDELELSETADLPNLRDDPDAGDGYDPEGISAHGAENELAQMQGKYQRALADYQNFQRRSAENERFARAEGSARVIEGLLDVIDNFDRALGAAGEAAEGAFGQGVRAIREELVRALSRHGLSSIAPEPNEEFDPMRHEALIRQPADGVRPGRVSALLQTGYALKDRVLRPAKVSVAPADESDWVADGPGTAE